MKYKRTIAILLTSLLISGVFSSCETKENDIGIESSNIKETQETRIESSSEEVVETTAESSSEEVVETTAESSSKEVIETTAESSSKEVIETTAEFSSNEVIETTAEFSSNETSVEIETFVSPQPLTFYNIDDYNKYIENNKMFDGFIYYEMIKSIGDFECLIFNDKYDEDNYYYVLRLNDVTNMDFNVRVHHMSEEEAGEYVPPVRSEVIKLDTPLDDFLICDVGETDCLYKYVYYNNIIYQYCEDSLDAIILMIDNIEYEFVPGYKLDFSDYKPEKDHILACLLSGNPDNVDLSSFFKVSSDN